MTRMESLRLASKLLDDINFKKSWTTSARRVVWLVILQVNTQGFSGNTTLPTQRRWAVNPRTDRPWVRSGSSQIQANGRRPTSCHFRRTMRRRPCSREPRLKSHGAKRRTCQWSRRQEKKERISQRVSSRLHKLEPFQTVPSTSI